MYKLFNFLKPNSLFFLLENPPNYITSKEEDFLKPYAFLVTSLIMTLGRECFDSTVHLTLSSNCKDQRIGLSGLHAPFLSSFLKHTQIYSQSKNGSCSTLGYLHQCFGSVNTFYRSGSRLFSQYGSGSGLLFNTVRIRIQVKKTHFFKGSYKHFVGNLFFNQKSR